MVMTSPSIAASPVPSGRRCSGRMPSSVGLGPPLGSTARVAPLGRRRALAVDGAGEEVHLRAADEAGDELVVGVLVELEGGAELADVAGVEDDDAVGEGHGLDLVVGDVDHGGVEAVVQLGDLDPHLDAQAGVEVGERLVEQEHARVADDGAADGDALALAAGELLGLAVEQVGDLQDAGGVLDPLLGGLGVDLRELEAEAHIVLDGHVRVERVGLEHHRDAALGRRQVVDDLVADHAARPR